MPRSLIAILLPLVLVVSSRADQEEGVVLKPRLGAGFGKMVEIEGRIVTDRDTRRRAHLGKKLIEVEWVGEKRLEKPVVLLVSMFAFAKVELPKRGTVVRFRGYETGGFSGIPKDAFKDLPAVATTNYHFKSWFQITKPLAPVKVKEKK